MGPIGSPETYVGSFEYSLRNNPEERSSQLCGYLSSMRLCGLQRRFRRYDIENYSYG
jgi:hypothetical protein